MAVSLTELTLTELEALRTVPMRRSSSKRVANSPHTAIAAMSCSGDRGQSGGAARKSLQTRHNDFR